MPDDAGGFKLTIRFCGLCLFVPHDGAMHVLLPAIHDHAAHHGHHGEVEPHHARLFHHSGGGYTMPGLDFSGCMVDFAPAGQGGADAAVQGLFDFTSYPWRQGVGRLRPGLLDSPGADGSVLAYLVLRAGSGRVINPGGRWELPDGSVRQMPTVLDWTIEGIPGESLEIRPGPLPGGDGACAMDAPLVLTPDPERREARLLVSYRTAAEWDPNAVGSMVGFSMEPVAHHFAAYYSLLEGEPRPELPVNRTDKPTTKGIKGDLVTCMLARTRV